MPHCSVTNRLTMDFDAQVPDPSWVQGYIRKQVGLSHEIEAIADKAAEEFLRHQGLVRDYRAVLDLPDHNLGWWDKLRFRATFVSQLHYDLIDTTHDQPTGISLTMIVAVRKGTTNVVRTRYRDGIKPLTRTMARDTLHAQN